MELGDFPHQILGMQKLKESRLLPLALTRKEEIRRFSDAPEQSLLPGQAKMRSSQKKSVSFH